MATATDRAALEAELADARADLERHAGAVQSAAASGLSNSSLVKRDLQRVEDAEAALAELDQVQPDPFARPGWSLDELVDLSSPDGWKLEDFTASNTASQDLPANVSFGPEGLRIVGRREQTPNGSPYSSGDAKGVGHPIPNYARVEVVGRGPHAPGLWPCVLWLRPLVGDVGEIDLMENFGGQPRAAATLHNAYGSGHKMIHGNLPWAALPDPTPAELHRYVLEKTQGRIVITCDDVVMMDVGPASPNPTAPIPDGFDWDATFEVTGQRWYPRVTLQIGCGTANPDCATGQPPASWTYTDMLVTELRIYAPA